MEELGNHVIHVPNNLRDGYYMKKTLLINIKGALIYLSVLLICTFLLEKTGKMFIFGYIFKPSLVIYFITSIYLNRALFINIKNAYIRYLLILIVCISITLLVGYIGLVIAINFNLTIGGSL